MPLIKPRTNRVKTVRHICRLQEPNRDALVLYARFIGDTADYVVNQLITCSINDRYHDCEGSRVRVRGMASPSW